MTQVNNPPLQLMRSGWLPLRTLILLRWMAILGQLFAIFTAATIFQFQIPLGLCLLVVSVTISWNIILTAIYPANKRLSETQSVAALLFDLLQLAALIFLTGGLTNPFALLMLAPVIVSASALDLRASILLGACAAGLTIFVFFFQMPLVQMNGATFDIPVLFKFGFLLSILIGIGFLGLYAHKVSNEISNMSNALLATQMALAREQKLTDLGGVVAAAAHELGTPLATIKLISAELEHELKDQPELREDAATIRSQADRCRDILREMGKAGKDDLLVRTAPFSAVVREAAEPHLERGKALYFTFEGRDQNMPEPHILRRPEIVHGLRNLIQNAVDFAAGQVWIDGIWTDHDITLTIVDDGTGFAPQVIGRIGDPFLAPKSAGLRRPEYDGMGLGLFIAKTLLERTGATLAFANAGEPDQPRKDRCGAVVEAIWPRSAIVANRSQPLGQNQQNI